jgi:hypothetical protein
MYYISEKHKTNYDTLMELYQPDNNYPLQSTIYIAALPQIFERLGETDVNVHPLVGLKNNLESLGRFGIIVLIGDYLYHHQEELVIDGGIPDDLYDVYIQALHISKYAYATSDQNPR